MLNTVKYDVSSFVHTLVFLLFSTTVVFTQTKIDTTQIDSDSLISVGTKDFLTGNTQKQKIYAYRKYLFINDSVQKLDVHENGSVDFNLSSSQKNLYSLSNEDLQQLKQYGRDNWDQEILRRYVDIPPTLPLNGLFSGLKNGFKSLAKPPDIRYLPIPTNTEIDVLKILWGEREATGSDLYAKLDSSVAVTAEDLQIILKNMVDKGLLIRKRISPLQTFSLFGVASIEIGPKIWRNDKNKIYLYRPVISKQTLLTYLESKRYLAFSAVKGLSNSQIASHYIAEKISLLVK